MLFGGIGVVHINRHSLEIVLLSLRAISSSTPTLSSSLSFLGLQPLWLGCPRGGVLSSGRPLPLCHWLAVVLTCGETPWWLFCGGGPLGTKWLVLVPLLTVWLGRGLGRGGSYFTSWVLPGPDCGFCLSRSDGSSYFLLN